MRILIVLPVANYSGSAIALFRVARLLIKIGWVVEVFSMKGPILEDFSNAGAILHEKFPLRKYSYVIFNSIASIGVALKVWDVLSSEKRILWLHEDENFLKIIKIEFSIYDKLKFDNIIYPAKYLSKFSEKFPSIKRTHFNNIVDVPFNYGENDGSMCVVGAYEARKNQDFILKNFECMCDLKFIGRNVSRIRSGNKIMLFEELSPRECIIQVSNSLGVVSASLMETQNLVALEAIQAGKPVLLSNITAHAILSKQFSNVELFDLDDVDGFRLGLRKIYEYSSNRERCFANSEVARSMYGEKRAEFELREIFGK
mgnify:CR=1 FL=1